MSETIVMRNVDEDDKQDLEDYKDDMGYTWRAMARKFKEALEESGELSQ